MRLHIKPLLISGLVLTNMFAFAQDTLRIKGTQKIPATETLEIAPGTQVIFEPGASLIVEGGLSANGTLSSPIAFYSENPNLPGQGIQVIGNVPSKKVSIQHATFSKLGFALHTSPFWTRSSFLMDEVTVYDMARGQSLVYISKPLSQSQLNLTISNSKFINNANGILIEGVGMKMVKVDLNHLSFLNNRYTSALGQMGLIHLDLTTGTFHGDNFSLDEILFHPETPENGKGISISGPSSMVEIGDIYSDGSFQSLVYDKETNHLLPKLIPASHTASINWPGNDFILLGLSHTQGLVSMQYSGEINDLELLNSSGMEIDFTSRGNEIDSLYLDYPSEQAASLLIVDGIHRIQLPEVILPIEEPEPLIGEGEEEEFEDEGNYLFNIRFLPYEEKNFVGQYRAGIWAGGAAYGGGDIPFRHWYLPPDLEYSFGAFLEYHYLKDWSFRGQYHWSRISAGNPYAPLPLSGHKGSFALNKDGDLFKPLGGFYLNHRENFRTSINSLELEVQYTPDFLELKLFGEKLQPSFGAHLGVFHFTPYRIMYIDSVNYDKLNLRDLGTGGQLITPGMKKYSPIAFNYGLSYQLTWEFQSFHLIGRAKMNWSSTDYLDDFGGGTWYGGDYERFVDKAVEETGLPEKTIRGWNRYNKNIAGFSPRSINGSNDWYFEWHFGVAIPLKQSPFERFK